MYKTIKQLKKLPLNSKIYYNSLTLRFLAVVALPIQHTTYHAILYKQIFDYTVD